MLSHKTKLEEKQLSSCRKRSLVMDISEEFNHVRKIPSTKITRVLVIKKYFRKYVIDTLGSKNNYSVPQTLNDGYIRLLKRLGKPVKVLERSHGVQQSLVSNKSKLCT